MNTISPGFMVGMLFCILVFGQKMLDCTKFWPDDLQSYNSSQEEHKFVHQIS